MKRIIALILCFIMACSAIGCGTASETDIVTQNESAEDTVPDTGTDAEAETIETDAEIDTAVTESECTETASETDTEAVTLEKTKDVTESEPVTIKETELITEAKSETADTSVAATEAKTAQTEAKNEDVQTIESTEAVVSDITEAETAEAVQEPVVPTVTDAVTYTKKVIEFLGENKGSFTDAYPPHSIVLPAISGDSEAITSINEEIIDDHNYIIEALKNNEEENLIYNIDYEYYTDDRILTVLLCVQTGRQASYRYDEYFAYYYDYINNKKLSFDECLGILGYDVDNLADIVAENVGMGFVADKETIGAVISDNGKITIIYEHPAGFGWRKLELE